MLFGEKTTFEAKVWLDKHDSNSAPGKSSIEKWFGKFKRGEMSIGFRSGCPKEALYISHSRAQSTVSRLDWTRWTDSEAWKNATVSWKGYGISILGCAWYYIHRLSREGSDHQQRVLDSVIGAFKRWNQEKTASFEEEKSADSSRQCTVSQFKPQWQEIQLKWKGNSWD
jgi:hypothetical protein